jgi:ferritin-like metal-binding protein YciE
MSAARSMILRYLEEAHATELALQRELETQIAMTPRGPYRADLERHLRETRDHAERVRARADELGLRRNPVRLGVGLVETAIGQALSIGRAPLVLLRGRGGEEKLLKNAKDSAAAEALEIATYTAIERLAEQVGDGETARLAASIRRDEERMLERVREHLGALADDVAAAQLRDDPSYDPSSTGAAEAARTTAKKARNTARRAGRTARRQADRVSVSVAPWAGYDDQTVDEIRSRIADCDDATRARVASYEQAHKGRQSVLAAADRTPGGAAPRGGAGGGRPPPPPRRQVPRPLASAA